MEKDHPFDDALIRKMVASYLTQKELVNCSCASQKWFNWFIPQLWHTRSFYVNLSEVKNLARYKEYVRCIIDFSINLAVASRDHWSFPNLQTVQFVQNCIGPNPNYFFGNNSTTGFGSYGSAPAYTHQYNTRASGFGANSQGAINASRVDLRLVKLLESAPLLQNLTITLSLDTPSVHTQFIQILQSLTHLNKLELTCNDYVNPMHIQQVINACRQCEELKLNFSGNDSFKGAEEEEEYTLAKAAMEEMEDINVKILSIDTTLSDQEPSIVVPLLKRCSQLETIHMYNIRLDSTVDLIQDALNNGACPKLKNFYPPNLPHVTRKDPLPTILGALGPGRGVDAVGLQTLTIPAYIFSPESVSVITQNLSQSLTTLNFAVYIMSFDVFNELVTGLPYLENLQARIEEISAQRVDINKFDQMCTRDWVCLGLKKLQLGSRLTQGIPTVKTESWKQSLPRRCMDYMFSQFNRLENLEEWDWIAGPVDLFILTGYLRTLPNLKKLRRLGLGPSTLYKMGAKEADWVADNWPSLNHVDLACRSLDITIADGSRVKPDKLALDAFIHTLRSKRPNITFNK